MLSDSSEEITILTTKVVIPCQKMVEFADWQSEYHALIASFGGFISLEFLSTKKGLDEEWTIFQRFSHTDQVRDWRSSEKRRHLLENLIPLLKENDSKYIIESESKISQSCCGITEVFVTQVSPEKEKKYREWIAEIHQEEAKFPGFIGVHVQAPSQGRNWITFLQFDTAQNLDKWLSSKEREKILSQSESMIESLDSHRVITPYAGWFSSIAKEGALPPPAWKQTMVVLLVLFPIVMLELKYFSILTQNLPLSLATFLANALSVVLIAWPFMPLAIKSLSWWLLTKGESAKQVTIAGTLLIIVFYLIEIVFFLFF